MMTTAHILVIAGLFTSRTLVDPAPIAYDPARNPAQITAAVAAASSASGWIPRLKDQRIIDATYRDRGGHSARVEITINPGEIDIRYLDSTNLSYSEDSDKREIHKVYLRWLEGLTEAINARLGQLCPDLGSLQAGNDAGQSFAALAASRPELAHPATTFEVKSTGGAPTGYVVRQYPAFLMPQLAGDGECPPASLVFYNDALVATVKGRAEQAAVAAYSDMLRYLVQIKAISFADAELERENLLIDAVMPLDPPRRAELLRFVEWQAQRLADSAISRQEYDYLLAQKEAEVQERQGSIQAKRQELDLMRQKQAQDAASADLQRQQLAVQRRMEIDQALANIRNTYRPAPVQSFNCTSTRTGSYTNTHCQ